MKGRTPFPEAANLWRTVVACQQNPGHFDGVLPYKALFYKSTCRCAISAEAGSIKPLMHALECGKFWQTHRVKPGTAGVGYPTVVLRRGLRRTFEGRPNTRETPR